MRDETIQRCAATYVRAKYWTADKCRGAHWWLIGLAILAFMWQVYPGYAERWAGAAGKIILASGLGYWIHRSLVGSRINEQDNATRQAAAQLSRALIIGASILGMTLAP